MTFAPNFFSCLFLIAAFLLKKIASFLCWFNQIGDLLNFCLTVENRNINAYVTKPLEWRIDYLVTGSSTIWCKLDNLTFWGCSLDRFWSFQLQHSKIVWFFPKSLNLMDWRIKMFCTSEDGKIQIWSQDFSLELFKDQIHLLCIFSNL